jgi:hypothetical protein
MDHFTLIGASFLLYALYVLLPIIPAALIFKMFPKTAVSLKGPLQNLTLNATGAFAAYITTVLLGFFLVNRIDHRIEDMLADMTFPAWHISTRIELKDNKGKAVQNPDAMIRDQLKVSVYPPLDQPAYPAVYLRVPLVARDQWPIVRFSLAGFQDAVLDLNSVIGQNGTDRDTSNRKLFVKSPIVLEQLPEPFIASAYAPDAKHVQPVSSGPPSAKVPAPALDSVAPAPAGAAAPGK